jgi:hypothetical protein
VGRAEAEVGGAHEELPPEAETARGGGRRRRRARDGRHRRRMSRWAACGGGGGGLVTGSRASSCGGRGSGGESEGGFCFGRSPRGGVGGLAGLGFMWARKTKTQTSAGPHKAAS